MWLTPSRVSTEVKLGGLILDVVAVVALVVVIVIVVVVVPNWTSFPLRLEVAVSRVTKQMTWGHKLNVIQNYAVF